MPKVFISHSTADREFVEREIIATLQEAGIETWYSQEDLRPKDVWERVIYKGLKACDWFLLVMSPRAEQSEWVRDELHWAMDHRLGKIVPVLIEECEPYEFHIRLTRIQRIDFRREQERVQAKSALIRAFLGEPQPKRRVSRKRRGTAAAPRPKPVAPPPSSSPSAPALLPEFVSPFTGMKLALIPAGSFEMGSPDDDKDADSDEKPRHRMTLSRPFYLGVYEVTQGEYQRVMGANPSDFKGADSLPVESVSWFAAVKFCNALSEKEGLTPFYKIVGGDQVTVPDWIGVGYRLPTEAEWEYACRAGSTTKYSFGDDVVQLGRYAWFRENSGEKTHAVGEKAPNAFGLHDMHGNVWEWCWDCYGDYKGSPTEDPSGPAASALRVVRGGSWFYVARLARLARAASRAHLEPSYRDFIVGLRCARVQEAR